MRLAAYKDGNHAWCVRPTYDYGEIEKCNKSNEKIHKNLVLL